MQRWDLLQLRCMTPCEANQMSCPVGFACEEVRRAGGGSVIEPIANRKTVSSSVKSHNLAVHRCGQGDPIIFLHGSSAIIDSGIPLSKRQ